MEVYKFGGASVKDAAGIKRVHQIILQAKVPLVVVISAMGKTTNLLEQINQAYAERQDMGLLTESLFQNHRAIIQELFEDAKNPYLKLYYWFEELLGIELKKEPSLNADYDYDRIVSFGELFSTAIISAYFHSQNTFHQWLDARKLIRTSNDYREGRIIWPLTKDLINHNVSPHQGKLFLTQGFLGSTETDQVVTLGREGSDFSAAIFANALHVQKMTIWKDVPGIMNADPRWYPQAELLEEMTYKEAVEMSFFGANVIHPKTLKPLENLHIPLHVKSFLQPDAPGTVIQHVHKDFTRQPVIIKKNDQYLITVAPKDFSFMQEDNLKEVFAEFDKYRIKVNIMEKAALSFTASVGAIPKEFEKMVDELRTRFTVRYNSGLQLLTIRHYNERMITDFTKDKLIYMEQRNRDTAWFVLL